MIGDTNATAYSGTSKTKPAQPLPPVPPKPARPPAEAPADVNGKQ